MKFYLHHYAEFFSLLVAIICYKRIKNSVLVYFIPFLFITLVAELTATYVSHVLNRDNYRIYNYLTTFSFAFYLLVLSRFIRTKIIKKATLPVSLIFVILCLVNFLILNKKAFHISTYCLGCILIIFYCLVYLYEVIRTYDIDFHVEKQPFFWIVIGLLFFYLSGMGYFIFINFFSKEFKELFNAVIRWLCVFMYGLFSIGFILCKNNKTKYLS